MNIFASLKRLHPGILLPMLFLISIGLAFVYSTTGIQPASTFFVRQMIWTSTGFLAFFLFLNLRYWRLLSWAALFYALAVLLLGLVLIFGKSRGISQSWLRIGPLTLQPSEFAKLAIVLVLARYLGGSAITRTWGFIAKGLAWASLPVALVLAQPDLGTTLVFAPIIIVMLWVGGARGRYLIMLLLAASLMLPIAFSHLKPYQRDRLLVFVNPDVDPLGAGYNIIQSKIAIGSGGILGKGFGRGTQNRLNFVPERHTDFIFSILAEEVGWWGGMLVLILFLTMIGFSLWIARRARDMQSKLLVVGLATMLFSHVLINVGVSMGVMPVTGLPLPFVSYGGSSLVTCMAAVALILNVGTRRF